MSSGSPERPLQYLPGEKTHKRLALLLASCALALSLAPTAQAAADTAAITVKKLPHEEFRVTGSYTLDPCPNPAASEGYGHPCGRVYLMIQGPANSGKCPAMIKPGATTVWKSPPNPEAGGSFPVSVKMDLYSVGSGPSERQARCLYLLYEAVEYVAVPCQQPDSEGVKHVCDIELKTSKEVIWAGLVPKIPF
jgi:hypothetical protein